MKHYPAAGLDPGQMGARQYGSVIGRFLSIDPVAFFAAIGIRVEVVITDDGFCYQSRIFAAALGEVIHRRTRPYRPQTNGKVERFN